MKGPNMPRLFGFLRGDNSNTVEGQLAPVAGVTTFAKDEVENLLLRQKAGGKWYGELKGHLKRDPTNKVDPNAINVMVNGARIGCLPSYLGSTLPLANNQMISCTVQIFSRNDGVANTVSAWVWFGRGKPKWEWNAKHYPPMTTKERSAHAHQQSTKMVRKSLAEGGHRAAEFKRGMVDGVHYLELYEPIQQLKREGRLEEALALCYQAIQGAENDRDGREPAPAYTLDAAIIHRKLGQRKEEIKVLERWVTVCPKDRRVGSSVEKRLTKLKAK